MSSDFPAPASEPHLDHQVTGQRLIAGLIDLVLLGVLLFFMVALFGEFGPPENRSDEASFGFRLGGGPLLLYLVLIFAYYIVAEATTGTTIGKAVMGLKVVKVSGEPYGFGAALVRNLLRIADGFFFYVVALICIAVTHKRQRLGDMAAGTLVVRG